MKRPFLYYFNLFLLLFLSNVISLIIAINLSIKEVFLELISKLILFSFLIIQYFLYVKFNKPEKQILLDNGVSKTIDKTDLFIDKFKVFYSGPESINLKPYLLFLSLLLFYLIALIANIIQDSLNPILKNLPFFYDSRIFYIKALKILILSDPLLSFFLIVIIGPFIEELTFRGFSFSVHHKKKTSLIITILMSLIFAIIHLDFPRIISLFAMGLALGLIYNLTQSLIYPITIHILNNGISYFTLFKILNSDNFSNILLENNIKKEFNLGFTITRILIIYILIRIVTSIYQKLKNEIYYIKYYKYKLL